MARDFYFYYERVFALCVDKEGSVEQKSICSQVFSMWSAPAFYLLIASLQHVNETGGGDSEVVGAIWRWH